MDDLEPLFELLLAALIAIESTPSEIKARLTTRVDEDIADWLYAFAEEHAVSVNACVQAVLEVMRAVYEGKPFGDRTPIIDIAVQRAQHIDVERRRRR